MEAVPNAWLAALIQSHLESLSLRIATEARRQMPLYRAMDPDLVHSLFLAVYQMLVQTFTSGDLILGSGGTVDLGANAVTVTGHALRIQAAGAVSGSGDLQAASLVIRGASGADASAAGSITLNGAGNAVGILDARSSGDIVFANTGGALTIRQANGAAVAIDALGQAATVEAGQAGITASDDVSLRAESIALNAGIP